MFAMAFALPLCQVKLYSQFIQIRWIWTRPPPNKVDDGIYVIVAIFVVPKEPQIKLMWQKLWAQNDNNDQIDEQMSTSFCAMVKHANRNVWYRVFVCIHSLIFCYLEFADEFSRFENDNNILVI